MKKKSLVILIALAWLLPFSAQAAEVDVNDATMRVIEVTDDHSDGVTIHIDVPEHEDESDHKDGRDDERHDADHDQDDDQDDANEREEEHESGQEDREDSTDENRSEGDKS